MIDIVKKLHARQAYPLDGAGKLINPDGPEAAEVIEGLRKENQKLALDLIAVLGQWHDNDQQNVTSKEKSDEQKWECPINYPGCVSNCGNYGCGN
jgi:hypothetical protein